MLVGLNPIVLVWGLGGDHNDFLMMFFIVLGFYLLLLRDGARPGAAAPERRRGARSPAARADGCSPLSAPAIGAGAAFVTAAAIKASGGVLIPVVLAGLLQHAAPARAGRARHGAWRARSSARSA